MARPSPELLCAAQALWDRGRTSGKEFSELSEFQRADLIADAAAVINSLAAADKAIERRVRLLRIV